MKNFSVKKNISYHILIINVIIIFVLFFIFNFNIEKKVKFIDNNFSYILSLKNNKNSKNIDFKILIKNISKTENIFDEKSKNMQLMILNNKTMIVDSKKIIIEKLDYMPDETFINYVSFKKLAFGDYKACLYLNESLDKKIELNFVIK
jgi:hypothetical protein